MRFRASAFGFLSNLGARQLSVAGFGDDVELGGFGTIRDDPTVVMRVKMKDRPEPPARSIGLRLRGTSFDRYAENRWSRTQFSGEEVRRVQDAYVLYRPPTADDFEYEIILDPMEEAVLFVPEGTVALRVPPTIRAGRSRYRKVAFAPGFDIRYRGLSEGPLAYKAYVGDEVKGIREPVPELLQARYLETPPKYERVAALAKQAAGAETDPRAQAQLIERFLRQGYRYSLEQPDTVGKDPLHVFLFDAKAGHCEYFSTAMAIMMRSLGVPSRNVTGFLGADYNPYGDYYAVRNGNAHQLGRGADRRSLGHVRPDAGGRPNLCIALRVHRKTATDRRCPAGPLGGVRGGVQHSRPGAGAAGHGGLVSFAER